jgi:hypothetical protein
VALASEYLAAPPRAPRLVGQRQQAIGVADQHVARRRQAQAASLVFEQWHAQRRLQLADACGDARLRAIEAGRCTVHAARLDDGAEGLQFAKFHDRYFR